MKTSAFTTVDKQASGIRLGKVKRQNLTFGVFALSMN